MASWQPPNFPVIDTLRDELALNLWQQVSWQPITVPWFGQWFMISTAYVSLSLDPSCEERQPPAPPILLLPGFDSSLLEFRSLVPLLSQDRSVWAIDPYGTGFTEWQPQVDVNPASIRQHLYSFWESQIKQPVQVVGASLGGAIAIDFALHYPDCVTSLVLIDSVGFSGSFSLGQWLPYPVIQWGVQWLKLRKQMALTVLSSLPGMNPDLSKAVYCSMLHQNHPGWESAIASFTLSGGYGALEEQVAQVVQPTLILWGDRDEVLGTADAGRFQQAIQRSQLVWIRGAGHAPHLEQPQAVAAAMRNFQVAN